MNIKTAKHIAKELLENIAGSSEYRLLESINTSTLNNFHYFADGKKILGAYKVKNSDEKRLWVLVIDWQNNSNYYVVIYPENTNLAPIAELHDEYTSSESTDLVWKYTPRKRDGLNEKRRKAFVQAVGQIEYTVSLPGAIVSVDDFLTDIFELSTLRVNSDKLTKSRTITKRTAFPEGRRVEKLHKYRERSSEIVRLAKERHALLNNGKLPCQICKFTFSDHYGKLGASYIEAHHIRPLSELKENERRLVTVDDFALVCSNCHRMLHAKRPWVTIKKLKNLLSQ